MQTQIEKLDGLKYQVKVQIDWTDVDQREQKELKKITQQANIPGFRPGKAPLNFIKQRYGQSVRQEVFSKIIEQSVAEIIEKQTTELAAYPDVTVDAEGTQEGQQFAFIMTYETLPEFVLNECHGEVIKKITAELTDEDVEKTLRDLQKQKATFTLSDKSADLGDVVFIDFNVFSSDGTRLSDMSEEGYRLVLGSDTMIPGFEEAIVGLSAGDEKEFVLTLPTDYGDESIAGQSIQFKVKVHSVNIPELPPLDDKFAEHFDIKEGGIDKLREETRHRLENELSAKLKSINHDHFLERLLEKNPMDLPEVLIASEQKSIRQERIARLKEYAKRYFGLEDISQLPVPSLEQFRSEAERRVALMLIMRKVIEQHTLTPDEAKIDELLKERFQIPEQDNNETLNSLKGYIQKNENFMNTLRGQALELQVIDKLLENVQFELEEQSFFYVMRGEENAVDHEQA